MFPDDVIENKRALIDEIILLSKQRGIDLEPFRVDFGFCTNRRFIFLWRKDSLPGTGPVNQPLGTLNYNMQGKITKLPAILKESSSAFQGAWSEAGSFETIEQAFELVNAWLVDGKEVDELPGRSLRRYQL